MDDLDLAAEREQIERDAAIANQRRKSMTAPVFVCDGCDCLNQKTECVDYPDCLFDFDRRVSAAVRNGRVE